MLDSRARRIWQRRHPPRGRMGPGGLPGLQNRVGVGDPGAGGFDSHAPSPPLVSPRCFPKRAVPARRSVLREGSPYADRACSQPGGDDPAADGSRRVRGCDQVIAEALRLMEEREQRRVALDAALAIGDEQIVRGEVVDWTPSLLPEIMRKAKMAAKVGQQPKPDVCPKGSGHPDR